MLPTKTNITKTIWSLARPFTKKDLMDFNFSYLDIVETLEDLKAADLILYEKSVYSINDNKDIQDVYDFLGIDEEFAVLSSLDPKQTTTEYVAVAILDSLKDLAQVNDNAYFPCYIKAVSTTLPLIEIHNTFKDSFEAPFVLLIACENANEVEEALYATLDVNNRKLRGEHWFNSNQDEILQFEQLILGLKSRV